MTPRKPEGKPRFQPTMVEFLMKTKENRDPGCYKLSQSFWAASQEASRCPNSDFWLPNSGLLPPIKLFIWKWPFSALRMVPPFMGSKQPLRASTAGRDRSWSPLCWGPLWGAKTREGCARSRRVAHANAPPGAVVGPPYGARKHARGVPDRGGDRMRTPPLGP